MQNLAQVEQTGSKLTTIEIQCLAMDYAVAKMYAKQRLGLKLATIVVWFDYLIRKNPDSRLALTQK